MSIQWVQFPVGGLSLVVLELVGLIGFVCGVREDRQTRLFSTCFTDCSQVTTLVAFVTITATSKTYSRYTSVCIMTNITYLLQFSTAFEVLRIVVSGLHTLSDFEGFGQA